MAKRILGVDIGYDNLKLALCVDGKIKKAATAPMPENLIKDSHITSLEMLGELIRTTMRKNGLHASRAALVLPNEMSYVRAITMPLMNAEQLAYNIPYEFNDYLVDELKSYTFDYAMLSDPKKDHSDTMELMAVAIHTDIIDEGRVVLDRAGLRLAKAAPSEYVYISLIRRHEQATGVKGEYCILDLGHRAIRMYMFRGDRHVVTRVLDVGLSNLDTILADAMSVDPHLAHTYLLTNHEDCQNQDACVNAFNNIGVELMRALNFYRFSNPDSRLSDVWISGGGTKIPRLCQVISENLGIPLHPIEELMPPSAGKTIENFGDYVMASGITMD